MIRAHQSPSPAPDLARRAGRPRQRRDIWLGLANQLRPGYEVPETELMSRQIYAGGSSDEIAAALRIMQNRQVRRLPILDEHGKLVRILSMDDVVLRSETKKRGNTGEIG